MAVGKQINFVYGEEKFGTNYFNRRERLTLNFSDRFLATKNTNYFVTASTKRAHSKLSIFAVLHLVWPFAQHVNFYPPSLIQLTCRY